MTAAQMHLASRGLSHAGRPLATLKDALWLLFAGCALVCSVAIVYTFLLEGLLRGALGWRSAISDVSPALMDCAQIEPTYHSEVWCQQVHRTPGATALLADSMRQAGLLPGVRCTCWHHTSEW